jgi:predicted RNase H-like nuclease (RuvC/YqgF family)
LEKTGVIDQLTKVLVGLYEEPEKPQNAVDFIKRSLGAPQESDVDQLKAENEELKRNVTELQKRVDALQRELEAERAKK